jgi:hypothetical protein
LNLGFQDKRKRTTFIVCAVLLFFAVAYAINNWPQDESGIPSVPSASSAPSTEAPAQNADAHRQRQRAESIDIYHVDPTIHLERLEQAAVSDYPGSQRNLFRYEAAPPPPPPKKTPEQIKEEQRRIVNTPPPPPPAIDLKYYGFSTDRATNTKKIFLTNGQDIFIVGEGEILANRYKVIRIGVNSVEVEDMRTKSRQQLPLTES